MLDIRYIREHPETVKKACQLKGDIVDVDKILLLDEKRKNIVKQIDEARHKHKKLSKEIGKAKREGKDIANLQQEASGLADTISKMEEKLRKIKQELQELLLKVPNVPHSSVPETEPIIVREWGKPKEFTFKPRDHIDLGAILNILDFQRGAKVAGSHFPCYKGEGAQLERALINFMLDFHVQRHNYTEIFPPFLVNRTSMTGTGQLPKLEDDMYLCERDDLFLNPTGEVPITNLHRDEILPANRLPIKYTGYTACFRREAGSYGKDTRGLTRVHQFNKVEMVRFALPEESYNDLEELLREAEEILQALGLHYRVVLLPANDLSFASTKTYDIEVWAPGLGRYLEVSSVSNFEEFQARRANIRIRRRQGAKPEYPHTLNGSGVATPRTMIAILETYQNEDGTISVPKVLQPYLGEKEIIGG